MDLGFEFWVSNFAFRIPAVELRMQNSGGRLPAASDSNASAAE
jgi:hypothetical protein